MIFNTPKGKIKAQRVKGMESNHRRPLTVCGYVFRCKDGFRYVCFDTDMPSVRNGFLHFDVTRQIKTYMSDHDFHPERECFDPLFSNRLEKDKAMGCRVIRKPFWVRGRIYKLKEEA